MKPRFLYHGSVRRIKGKFTPRLAKDLGEVPENIHKAVYATDIKEIAIAMAIISCKGVKGSSLSFRKKPYGTIYEGWPEQKYIYLYTLHSDKFVQMGGGGNQWASFEPVKPIRVERLIVTDYIYLVRKATSKEIKEWFKEYGNKIKNKRKKQK